MIQPQISSPLNYAANFPEYQEIHTHKNLDIAMADSCSHWWHAPFYVAMSIVLAFVITTTIHGGADHPTPLPQISKQNLSLNVSRALRRHGFHVFATVLQFSPELFLSFPETTIFAVQDSAISNATAPLQPWMMKQLLQYHASPSKLPMKELLKKPQGNCLKTLLDDKYIKITKNDEAQVEINNVLISHPDIFANGPFSVHGVLGPFSQLDFHGSIDHDWDFIHSPICEDFGHKLVVKSKISLEEWSEMIKRLNAEGFVSFAIVLQSVLDGILQESANFSSVTILAPSYFASTSSKLPLMERVVGLHILPQKFTYRELAQKSSLRTMVRDRDLKIKIDKFSQVLAIDQVEIIQPDVFLTDKFIIHGISRALEMEEISGSF